MSASMDRKRSTELLDSLGDKKLIFLTLGGPLETSLKMMAGCCDAVYGLAESHALMASHATITTETNHPFISLGCFDLSAVKEFVQIAISLLQDENENENEKRLDVLSSKNVVPICELAHFLQCRSVLKATEDVLTTSVDRSNCQSMAALADRLQLLSLFDQSASILSESLREDPRLAIRLGGFCRECLDLLFGHKSDNCRDSLEWKALIVSLFAQEALDPGMLAIILGCSKSEALDAIDKIRIILYIPSDYSRFEPINTAIKEWFTRKHTAKQYYVHAADAEKMLGGRCLEFFRQLDLHAMATDETCMGVKKDLTRIAPYLLKHTARHLVNSGSKELYRETTNLFFNPDYVMARALREHKDTQPLHRDCMLLGLFSGSRVVYLLGRALQLSQVSVRRSKGRELPSQLIGRLLGSCTGCGGHHDAMVARGLGDIVARWRNHDFGFGWWCPLTPCWEQVDNDSCVVVFGNHVKALALSPDGSQIATGHSHGLVCVWDRATGACLKNFSTLFVRDGVDFLQWSPDGSSILSCAGQAMVWNLATGSRRQIGLQQGRMKVVACSPNGKQVACFLLSNEDNTPFRILDIDTGSTRVVLKMDRCHSALLAGAWSPDGNSIVASFDDAPMLRVWDCSSGEVSHVLNVPDVHPDVSPKVTALAFSPSGQSLVTASMDKTVRLWNFASGTPCQHTVMEEGHDHKHKIVSVRFSPDGSSVFSSSLDATIRVWDTTTMDCKNVLDGGNSWAVGACTAAWSRDSKFVASITEDGSVMVSQAVAMAESVARHKSIATMVRSKTTNKQDAIQQHGGHTSPVNLVVWSYDGLSLASAASKDYSVRVWDAVTGKCLHVLEGHTKTVNRVVWSPDGTLLLSCSDSDESSRVWDVTTGVCVHVLDFSSGGQWSPNSLSVLTTHHIFTALSVWDVNTGNRYCILDGRTETDFKGEWSPDSRFIVTTRHRDRAVRVWDAKDGCCHHVLKGKKSSNFDVAWATDGSCRLAMKNARASLVSIWNYETGECQSVGPESVAGYPPPRFAYARDILTMMARRASPVSISPQDNEDRPRSWNDTNDGSDMITGVDCNYFSVRGDRAVGLHKRKNVHLFAKMTTTTTAT